MATLWKLTDSDLRTRGGTKWELGVKQEIHPALREPKLCTNGVLHAYDSPLQMLLYRDAHGKSGDGRHLFEAKGVVRVKDGSKVGTYELTLIKEFKLPRLTQDDMKRLMLVALLLKANTAETQWILHKDFVTYSLWRIPYSAKPSVFHIALDSVMNRIKIGLCDLTRFFQHLGSVNFSKVWELSGIQLQEVKTKRRKK